MILPSITTEMKNDEEQYGIFLRIVVSVTALLCMVGVTCFSVFVHMILNKIEYEKQKKFVMNRLYVVINESSVKSDAPTLSTLYEKFHKTKNNIPKLLKQLTKGDPINW